jgi:hypothetical protein
LITFSIIGAMAAPASAVSSQAPSDGGVIDVAPESTLFFAQANLDTSSDQMIQAAALLERAGLGDPLEEAAGSGDLPANTQAGVVVTSIPEASELDVTDVSVDPMAATDSLDAGGYAIVVASDDTQSIFDSELSSMQSEVDFGSGTITEVPYGGVTITVFTPNVGEEYVDAAALAMVGDYVVMAMRAVDIHPIVDTFNGDTPSLATNERYQEVSALLPAEFIANGYLDGPGTLQAIETSSPEALQAAGPQATQMLDSWSGFTFSAEADGFRLETRSIAAGEPFDAITPIDGAFFDNVPSDALFATNGTNINANGWVTLLAFAFASEFVGVDLAATPVAEMDIEATQEQVFAQAEQMLGFNLKTDFVDLLAGEFGITLTISDVASDTPSIDALIVSDVTDPATMRDTMTKIAMIAGAGLGDQTAVEERDVNGSVVNVVDISTSGIADKAEFGVVDDELVISMGSGLDDYIAGPAAPLSSDPNFTAVMEHMPAEYGSLTYVNMPVVMEVVTGFSASMEGAMEVEDADPACAEYATQEDAQAAYDADQFGLWMLDQDFDGEACEDYFAPATAVATPAVSANPYPNVIGLATATTQEDGVNGTTSFLLIGGE